MSDPDKKNDEEAIGSDTRPCARRRSSAPVHQTRSVSRRYLDCNGEQVALNEAVTLERAVPQPGRD